MCDLPEKENKIRKGREETPLSGFLQQRTPPLREALVVDVFHDVLYPALEDIDYMLYMG